MTKNQWRLYVARQWIDEVVWPVRWALWLLIAGCLWVTRSDWRRQYQTAVRGNLCNMEWPLAVPTRWRRIVTGVS